MVDSRVPLSKACGCYAAGDPMAGRRLHRRMEFWGPYVCFSSASGFLLISWNFFVSMMLKNISPSVSLFLPLSLSFSHSVTLNIMRQDHRESSPHHRCCVYASVPVTDTLLLLHILSSASSLIVLPSSRPPLIHLLFVNWLGVSRANSATTTPLAPDINPPSANLNCGKLIGLLVPLDWT